MTEQAPAHLLVIDRDERLRDLLRQYLKTQGFLVSAARDEAHAGRLLSGLEFDLILLDAQLPGANTLRAALATPVLCLTEKGAPAPKDTNAIAKPFEPKALCETINGILDRRPPPPAPGPRILRLGPLSFDVESGALMDDATPVRLTATEIQLMRIFAEKPGQPVGRGELVARLGREGLHAKARAVDVQITRLRRKVEADPKNPRHLQTVRGSGYMLVVD
ncbi:winged helix-turn-helix domain-containing protein [Sinisalibacter aestuarii]|uniref:DNA-binding response regulator n=1 Tax=Sinisalibacter aestuarii TaxID=2949426 RepID=A0ABQ5LNN1_9RHOB|nr:response regulator transcription factor [Sinisalibacter aestuarii]GKY86614.1 DNA-binding response regulator [Sinisalibacter aestuarii]